MKKAFILIVSLLLLSGCRGGRTLSSASAGTIIPPRPQSPQELPKIKEETKVKPPEAPKEKPTTPAEKPKVEDIKVAPPLVKEPILQPKPPVVEIKNPPIKLEPSNPPSPPKEESNVPNVELPTKPKETSPENAENNPLNFKEISSGFSIGEKTNKPYEDPRSFNFVKLFLSYFLFVAACITVWGIYYFCKNKSKI